MSELKKFITGHHFRALPILPTQSQLEQPQPIAILGTCIRAGQPEVLVHWTDSSPADASWENALLKFLMMKKYHWNLSLPIIPFLSCGQIPMQSPFSKELKKIF